MALRSVTVFCGSKSGNNPLFQQHTEALGAILAQHNITIIYGGGNKGLMGAVANASMQQNGKVIGIIPELLTQWEHQHVGLSELHVVDSMHSRKIMLYEKCDAAVILPGGYGTLDEVFEMLTWNQLNIHNKPVFILNSAGFYNHLIAHIDHMHTENFLYYHPNEKITVLSSPEEIIPFLNPSGQNG
jgi:uncharacterized protein (TIGR00730 family)